MLRQLKKSRGGGISGWAAVNRRGVLNADAALDLGLTAQALEPPLRSAVTVPLINDGRASACSRVTRPPRPSSPKTISGCWSCWQGAPAAPSPPSAGRLRPTRRGA